MNTFKQNKIKTNKGSIVSVSMFVIGLIIFLSKSFYSPAGVVLILFGLMGCVIEYLREKNIIKQKSKISNIITRVLPVLGVVSAIYFFIFYSFWMDVVLMVCKGAEEMNVRDIAEVLCELFEISK